MNLIDRFKRVNALTIWHLMGELATEPDVFSSHPHQLTPHLTNDTYVYVYDVSMVIIYIDRHSQGQAVLADEEVFNEEYPLYFTESTHWVSPVYKLHLAIRGIRRVLKRLDMQEPCIHAVCLSNTHIINKKDMLEVWAGMGITMIDDVHIQNDIKVLENFDTSGGFLFMNYMMHKSLAEWDLNIECDFTIENDSEAHEQEEIDIDIPNVGNLKGIQIIKPIRHPDRLLEQLIGLEDIKRRISELTMFTQYNYRLRTLGAKDHQISLHCVFSGNPGTGKTTIGRIFASLLLQAGILSKGHLILVNGRQAFIGSNFGAEETVVETVLSLAEGGILFIDEAYTLNGNHKDDPGKLVLPMLMQVMADESRRDLGIVIAGYQKPMEQLIELNSGLDSRFKESNRFHFQDYSPQELFQIAMGRMVEYGYTITKEAQKELMNVIVSDFQNRNPENFGNGRYITNRMEELFMYHGVRCIKEDIDSLEKLHSIELSDVLYLQQKKGGYMVKAKKKIGFNS